MIKVTPDSTIERKKRALVKYFGSTPRSEDLFGENPFPQSYEELEELAAGYRQWYKRTAHRYEDLPVELELPYQVHHNLSSETLSRAKLLSATSDVSFEEALAMVLSIRSMPIPIDSLNGAVIYASTIYRGKTQVNTGTLFEKSVMDFVNNIDDSIEMIPGKRHDGKKYDKDIMIDGEYELSAEISFQVTTNSVMERKSHLGIPTHLTVIFVFGGLGWVERINALERIASDESGYSECFGPSDSEFERLKDYILSFK